MGSANFIIAEIPRPFPKDKKGSIEPVMMICPDVHITYPKGDPEKPPKEGTPVSETANESNEAVFDDRKPRGERVGECLLYAKGKSFEDLTKESARLVWSMLSWNIDKAGTRQNGNPNVPTIAQAPDALRQPGDQPTENQRFLEARTNYFTKITYTAMPKNAEEPDGNGTPRPCFGRRKLTLAFGQPRAQWRYYQKVELFFHWKGRGNPGRDNYPNWFYYWRQFVPMRRPRCSGGFIYTVQEPNKLWKWTPLVDRNGHSRIRVSIPGPSPKTGEPLGSLSGFLGMMRHEEKHEHDFYEVIWNNNELTFAVNDTEDDPDRIHDDWERKSGAWKEKHDPSSNDGGWGTTDKGFWFYFETEREYSAWSDVRADIAAKAAVDANRFIDRRDWSDLHVTEGFHIFTDDNPPRDYKFVQTTLTTGANNKHWQPEEVPDP